MAGSKRELQRWQAPSSSPAELELLYSKPDKSRDRVWDQFAANEVLFGVKSTYQENMSQYTTPLPSDAGSSSLEGFFRIDADICDRDSNRNKAGSKRELQRWQAPSSSPAELELLYSKPDKSRDRVWDQFAANEVLFGVKSTYKEDMSQYTTPLDIGRIPDSIKKQANKIAREIEQRPAVGAWCEPDLWGGDDEEQKFPAVSAHRWHEQKEARRSGRTCVVKDCTWVVKGVSTGLPGHM